MMLSPNDWKGLMEVDRYTEDQKLEITSTQFESTLIRQFLSEAMKPMVEGYLNEDSVAQDIYRGYFTDIMSQSLSSGGGLGISNVLQSQLTMNHQQTKETDES